MLKGWIFYQGEYRNQDHRRNQQDVLMEGGGSLNYCRSLLPIYRLEALQFINMIDTKSHLTFNHLTV